MHFRLPFGTFGSASGVKLASSGAPNQQSGAKMVSESQPGALPCALMGSTSLECNPQTLQGTIFDEVGIDFGTIFVILAMISMPNSAMLELVGDEQNVVRGRGLGEEAVGKGFGAFRLCIEIPSSFYVRYAASAVSDFRRISGVSRQYLCMLVSFGAHTAARTHHGCQN